ncbi:MAG: dehydratase [Hyphomicrobiales bacterium]|nr:MAG: dehydratase [Hyphomicrobiales bacterium]
MENYPLPLGAKSEFVKTISESDVYLFAGITGDLAPVHVNENMMRKSVYGARIVHGVLIVGMMSTTVTLVLQKAAPSAKIGVSLGFDRIRFLRPVFIGDTVTVTYEVSEIIPEKWRSIGKAEAFNQDGDLVCAANHVMKWT